MSTRLISVLRNVTMLSIVLILVSMVTFLLLELIPGDPLATILPPDATPEMRAEAVELYGFNDPLWVRYWDWLSGVLQGDFGRSIINGLPVSTAILERLPVTLEIAVVALAISLAVSVPLAVYCGYRPGGIVDRVTTFLASVILSVPNFLLGVLLVFVFAVQLGWLPVLGWTPLAEGWVPHLQSLALPVLTLAAGETVAFVRILRNDMVATLQQDFALSARARGISTPRILFRHALRPSSFSLVTVLGVTLGRLVGGTVIVESLFSLPGLGTLVISAITNRDYLVVQGVVLLIAVAYVLSNALVDLMYPLLDPRVRAS